MPENFTSVLGRLLTDSQLRAEFERDANQFARRLTLSDRDRNALLSIPATQLAKQAQTLVEKRFAEVRSLLPQTFEQLGPRSNELFNNFAASYWPEGHKRHLADAIHFGEYLKCHAPELLVRSESNQLQAVFNNRLVHIGLIPNMCINGRNRLTLYISLRRRNMSRVAWTIYLGC